MSSPLQSLSKTQCFCLVVLIVRFSFDFFFLTSIFCLHFPVMHVAHFFLEDLQYNHNWLTCLRVIIPNSLSSLSGLMLSLNGLVFSVLCCFLLKTGHSVPTKRQSKGSSKQCTAICLCVEELDASLCCGWRHQGPNPPRRTCYCFSSCLTFS